MNQRLGFRALVLSIVKGLLPGLVLAVGAVVVLLMKNAIGQALVSAGYGADTVGKILLFAVGGLYVFAVIMLGLGLVYALIGYFSTRFGLDDYAFKLHRGLISRDEVTIPYHQIQDVNVEQSVIGRIFGVGTMIILTAGQDDRGTNGEENEIVFPIVDIGVAKDLQKRLEVKGSVQLVKQAPGN
ncbi:MAG: PH domain-containing protein [Patescibacteria group bacterium]|nr:PH domain-containing protein [Patescibacteria group bacterium]MDE1945612.1 PH domain-containing protein [Patescibacteria group bacterium]